jgi:surface polysaccharide O-acyltransferase-like enzyme
VTPGRPREVAGDALRALAIVAVVAIHSAVWGPKTSYGTVQVIARFSVPVFVVVSGLALAYRYSGTPLGAGFARRRLTRTLLPWLVWVPVYVVINIFIFNAVQPTIASIVEFIDTGGGYLWFLLLIPQLYVVFTMWPRRNHWSLAAAAVAVQVAVSLLRVFNALPGDVPWWTHRYGFMMFPFYIGYFAVGVALGRDLAQRRGVYGLLQRAREHIRTVVAALAIAVVASATLVVLIKYPGNAFASAVPDTGGFINPVLPLLVFSIAALTVVTAPALLHGQSVFAQRVRALSDLSLGVYIIHPVVVWLLGRYVMREAIHADQPLSALAYLSLIVLGVVIAMGLTRWLTALPLAVTVGARRTPLQRDIAVLAPRRRDLLVLRHAQGADEG